MIARDVYDWGRAVAPLRRADDAVELDTSGLDIEQVVEAARRIVATRLGASAWSTCPSMCPATAGSPHRARRLRPHAVRHLPAVVRGRRESAGERRRAHRRQPQSELDPFFVGHVFPRPVRDFAKSELFRQAPYTGR